MGQIFSLLSVPGCWWVSFDLQMFLRHQLLYGSIPCWITYLVACGLTRSTYLHLWTNWVLVMLRTGWGKHSSTSCFHFVNSIHCLSCIPTPGIDSKCDSEGKSMLLERFQAKGTIMSFSQCLSLVIFRYEWFTFTMNAGRELTIFNRPSFACRPPLFGT